LCRLDDRELKLEQTRLLSEREQLVRKHRQALAAQERSNMTILAAQIDQVEAMLTLVSDKLARATLVAPFDGVVVSGDLHQLLGTPVELGKVLFQIAPLDAYRVILQVDERDIAYLQVGQPGVLTLIGSAERVHGFLSSADYTCIYRPRRPQLFPGRGAAPRALGNRASRDGGRRQDRRRRTHPDLGLDAQFRQLVAPDGLEVAPIAGAAWQLPCSATGGTGSQCAGRSCVRMRACIDISIEVKCGTCCRIRRPRACTGSRPLRG
jgi:hypothetical protein